MESLVDENIMKPNNFITEEDVKIIVNRCGHDGATIENFFVCSASDKMLGFLAEYWKLKINLSYGGVRKEINLFIKALSRTNAVKAGFVKELKLLDKEINFYSQLKIAMNIPDLNPYCADLVTVLDDAMVLSDLNAMQYRCKNKLHRFDTAHTLETLKTLARFHASSIVFEEKKSQELGRIYHITEDYGSMLDKAGYHCNDSWYIAGMKGCIEILKSFSKYADDWEAIKRIEQNLPLAWLKALELTDASPKYKNVINHRDLWNNNILFHYKLDHSGVLQPDDCVLVDFQAIRYQPPTGDIMLMLCCNLDCKTREENMNLFLNFYYNQLTAILADNNIDIRTVLPMSDLMASADDQMLWGMTAAACLFPQIMLDDDLVTTTFSDTEKFDQILFKDKVPFVVEVMKSNPVYKKLVLDLFEEYAERFCLEELKIH